MTACGLNSPVRLPTDMAFAAGSMRIVRLLSRGAALMSRIRCAFRYTAGELY
jgi:hypothetical protein